MPISTSHPYSSYLAILYFQPLLLINVLLPHRLRSAVGFPPSPHRLSQCRFIHGAVSEVLLLDEKTRLGSTPPSCHSRCDECNPCTAVQVPTVPAHNRGEPGLGRAFRFGFSSPLISNKYPNYKPLGWKCRCGDRVLLTIGSVLQMEEGVIGIVLDRWHLREADMGGL
ncbi:hypothetical protein ACLOJK_013406 [Asimina triloba]